MPVRRGRTDILNLPSERPPEGEPYRFVDPFGVWWRAYDRVPWRPRRMETHWAFTAPGHVDMQARHFVRQFDRAQFVLSINDRDWIGDVRDLSEETVLEQLRRARSRGAIHIPAAARTTREAELAAYARDYPGGVPRPSWWSEP